MERMVLTGIIALAASTALAQTAPTGAGPANLCQELLVFMQEPEPKGAEAMPAPARTERPSAKADGTAVNRAEKPAAAPGQSTKPQSDLESTSAQELTGQSGPANESPEENPAPVKEATVHNAPQRNSVSAPVTNSPSSTSKGSVLSVAEAQALADSGDIAACQAAVRELRIAGVAIPAPLLALTALDLQYQSADTEPQTPKAGDVPTAPTRTD